MSSKAQLLKTVDLFSLLNDEQIRLLSAVMFDKRYKKGDTILMEDDDQSHGFFLIESGEVKVVLTSEDGREAILSTLKSGEFFGEMSLLDGEPRSATVKAVEDSKLYSIRREDFMQAIRKHPDLALHILTELSRRLRRSNRMVSSLTLMKVVGRVATVLLKLMEDQGVRTRTKEGKSIVVIKNRPTQQHMADMAGAARETVSRVFKEMERKGLIAISGRDLIILEEKQLHS